MRCLRKWLIRLVLAGVILAVAAFGLFLYLKPPLMPRTEIYRGVFLTVEEVPEGPDGRGRAMIAEIHWETPGIRLAGREYSFPVDPANPITPHYRLVPADWALSREGAAVLVNSAGYKPETSYRSLPGMPVRAMETVVVDGQPSRVHKHSYLLYWDKDMEVHLQQQKPPDAASLEAAVLGIGLQGIPILNGKDRGQGLDHLELVMPRTFIGVDPDRKVLYLLVFEHASGHFMLSRAVEAGVQYGGMLDSGDATHLLIGSKAKGIHSHQGIRNWRPLGPYLTVFADPLQK